MPMSATLGAIGLLAAEEDPTRTHSWIFPEGSEILWGTLSFLVVAFLLWKFAWPQAKQMMDGPHGSHPGAARRGRRGEGRGRGGGDVDPGREGRHRRRAPADAGRRGRAGRPPR